MPIPDINPKQPENNAPLNSANPRPPLRTAHTGQAGGTVSPAEVLAVTSKKLEDNTLKAYDELHEFDAMVRDRLKELAEEQEQLSAVSAELGRLQRALSYSLNAIRGAAQEEKGS